MGVPQGVRQVAETGPLSQPSQVGLSFWLAFIWSRSYGRRKWPFLCAALPPHQTQ